MTKNTITGFLFLEISEFFPIQLIGHIVKGGEKKILLGTSFKDLCAIHEDPIALKIKTIEKKVNITEILNDLSLSSSGKSMALLLKDRASKPFPQTVTWDQGLLEIPRFIDRITAVQGILKDTAPSDITENGFCECKKCHCTTNNPYFFYSVMTLSSNTSTKSSIDVLNAIKSIESKIGKKEIEKLLGSDLDMALAESELLDGTCNVCRQKFLLQITDIDSLKKHLPKLIEA